MIHFLVIVPKGKLQVLEIKIEDSVVIILGLEEIRSVD